MFRTRQQILWLILLIAIVGCQKSQDRAKSNSSVVIAMLPKLKGIAYFDACEKGARKAAAELGVHLIFDGPISADAAKQNDFVDTWIQQRVQAICIAPNQPKAIESYVKKAQAAGIKVLTWDTDAPESGRDLMVSQVEDRILGETGIEELARQMGNEGEWAVVIGSLEATNLNSWRRYAEVYADWKYPKLKKVATEVTGENEDLARQKVEALMNAHPSLKGIFAFDSNSLPGAAEALKRAGKAGKIALVGHSTPSQMKKYLEEGVLQCFFLWDPRALGDLTVRMAKLLIDATKIEEGMEVPGFGRIHLSTSDSKVVILSPPVKFTRENVANYDF